MFSDRFLVSDTKKPMLLQPHCPVYVHCLRLCTEREVGAVFLQVRLVNRSDRSIRSVLLRIEGTTSDGSRRTLELPLSDCAAAPHCAFGEERMLAVPPITDPRVTVVRVQFTDGLLWNRLPAQEPVALSQTQWRLCRCGMPNPPDAPLCAFCRRGLTEQMPLTELLPRPRISIPPVPIVRSPAVRPEPEEESAAPVWLIVLLCVLAVGAVAALMFFLLFYLRQSGI